MKVEYLTVGLEMGLEFKKSAKKKGLWNIHKPLILLMVAGTGFEPVAFGL